MLKKTLIAMAVAGALGASTSAFADSDTHHTASPNVTSHSMSETSSFVSAADSSPVIEIGDGIMASAAAFDDVYDGMVLASDDSNFEEGGAVGSTSGIGASGSVAFSSDG